jgi:hypothetical protein
LFPWDLRAETQEIPMVSRLLRGQNRNLQLKAEETTKDSIAERLQLASTLYFLLQGNWV